MAVADPGSVAIESSSEQSPDSVFGGEIDEEDVDVIREANQFRPSVMAISFSLPSETTVLHLSFCAGSYDNVDIHDEGKNYTLHEYKRVALNSGVLTITLPKRAQKVELFNGRAMLQIVRRKEISTNSVLWTVSIENTKIASRSEIEQNTASLFQCTLIIKGPFCPIDTGVLTTNDEDRQKQSFLYRNTHSYAAGHGCSVTWDSASPCITEIRSTFLPGAVVSQMIAVTDSTFRCFLMSSWIDDRKEVNLSELESYIDKYRDWASKLLRQLTTIPANYQSVAKRILDSIDECIERLEMGIATLCNDEKAWKAFCLMNKAMMRQSAKRRNQDETSVSWYPFQLCYVLMCVPDMSDSCLKWRDTVDLLWFPTGGGKTEAYLGVAAFTIFYRRLTKGEQGRGITVLMRYTLRMLTSQQFERAAALICECDLIRRQEKIPGGEISIGLWVGSEVTPNHVISDWENAETAATVLEKLKGNLINEVRSTPAQLSACPYCGTPLLFHNSYSIKDNQFKTHCPDDSCPFHDDLPVITVDDDIYTRRPALLIGTIDKFARLAWEDRTGTIFAEDGYGLPPELLIQDELHLISGPLGSISGLYELTIEKLCEQNGIKPKILASTATLCNASEQIRALYGKKAFQFPPSGFSAEDFFFAKTATKDERPERQYIGFCETGGSLPDAVVRTFGVVKYAVQYLIKTGTDPKVIDQFWTNVGYFNSLKDLGSADTLIIDRVCSYAESLRRHKFSVESEKAGVERITNEYEYGELTSRKSSREIAEIRNQLDKQHYPSTAALNYVLSSNMLSVGIDINRLGLMTVYGQPKATAEYIQATSRVGRSNPGLVIVLLNMLRTRDKSHFEQFKTYHQALNKMVEPASVTPYACRTMDKALHAVFITLVRHMCPDLRANKDAAKFRSGRADIRKIRDDLISMIADRSAETAGYAEDILDEFIEQWNEAAITRGARFQYQLLNRSENDTDALLIPAEKSENALFPPTMNSMRNVDTQSGVYLKR
ncbi:MAG: helicase-related protein [Clostridia bacterium]|nr:helicase-related protein [Clostridia bacterium]